ncbi:hypothetical protein BGI41_02890 [Methanobrevibacter sp. 87.7]|uniref:hypothetical protein n=1 Tax=Methanobrevibacter sp. 87.7 TaxID=387957 RepID=UPI000B5063CE|nr:hypothetical protein [Methanobrevibacter sp. 87.7]OWT33349.1 hypothetical protein BGI41_02890 [Methanobrevibacter sp. 87.7]
MWLFDFLGGVIGTLLLCCIAVFIIAFLFGFVFVDQNTLNYPDNQVSDSGNSNYDVSSSISNVSVENDSNSINVSGVDQNGTPIKINIQHG